MVHGMSNLSLGSLYIEMFYNDIRLATGTAFVAKNKKGYFLITNRHNVTGVGQDGIILHPKGGLPNKIKVYHHLYNQPQLTWKPTIQDLYNTNGEILWFEHPTLKEKADFVALKIENTDDLKFLVIEFNDDNDINKLKLAPSDRVSVIGYPFGYSAGESQEQYLGIWANGFIASEPFIDYQGLPVVLIDCRTRSGQSGSPVFALSYTGKYDLNNSENKFDRIMKNFDRQEFLGIYSGRINKDSDIGFVWKSSAIKELLDYIDFIF